MKSKSYDYKMLVQIYVAAQKDNYIHEDFKNYYVQLLSALEDFFEIEMSQKKFDSRYKYSIRTFLDMVVGSYHKLMTPRNFYLEDSGLNVALREMGEQGAKILQADVVVGESVEASKAAHLQLMYDIFECLWGKIDRVITSEELKERGFDDAKEPQIWDYFDYM